jgi:hypothetical protein
LSRPINFSPLYCLWLRPTASTYARARTNPNTGTRANANSYPYANASAHGD